MGDRKMGDRKMGDGTNKVKKEFSKTNSGTKEDYISPRMIHLIGIHALDNQIFCDFKISPIAGRS